MAKDNAKRKRPKKATTQERVSCFLVWLKALHIEVAKKEADRKTQLIIG